MADSIAELIDYARPYNLTIESRRIPGLMFVSIDCTYKEIVYKARKMIEKRDDLSYTTDEIKKAIMFMKCEMLETIGEVAPAPGTNIVECKDLSKNWEEFVIDGIRYLTINRTSEFAKFVATDPGAM